MNPLLFNIMKIQTDNGSEFKAAFHWHLLDKGIQHVYIRPATPRFNGKVERSHLIDYEEFFRSSPAMLATTPNSSTRSS